jgi:hypothetical protein
MNKIKNREVKFSLFHDPQKGIFNTTPERVIDFNELIQIYNSDRLKQLTESIQKAKTDEEKKSLKMGLPFITPNGTFSYRNSDNLIEHNSNLVALDIDELTTESAKRVKSELSKSDACLLVAISPRQRGVKALILIDNELSAKDRYNVLKLNKGTIAKSLNISEFKNNIDTAQFVLTQPFFLAYDSDLYVNIEPSPINLDLIAYVEYIAPKIEVSQVPIKANNRIEKYILNATDIVNKSFALCGEGNRHSNIIKVQSISSIIHYAPSIGPEVKQSLLNSVIAMYGDEARANKSNAIKSFHASWNETPRSNNTIESIIDEITNLQNKVA